MTVNSWWDDIRVAHNASSVYYESGGISADAALQQIVRMAKKRQKGKFPNKIALWRELRDKTQWDLADVADREQPTINRYENGEIDVPSSILAKIATYLVCTTDDLLKRTPGIAEEVEHEFRDVIDKVLEKRLKPKRK